MTGRRTQLPDNLEIGKIGPGRYRVEGWAVEREPAARLSARRYYWHARRGGVELIGFTLADVCSQIIDHDARSRKA